MRSKKKAKQSNLNLVLFFFAFILFLIIGSFTVKSILYVKDSKFDGTNNFIVAFVDKNSESVVAFSPINNSISILKVDQKIDKNNLSKTLQIPIDAVVKIDQDVTDKNVGSVLLKSSFPLEVSVEGMNKLDCLRLFLFAKGVGLGSIYQRELTKNINDAQKSTLLSLSFTDPAIYRENQSIQIVNAANIYGLGAKLANLITNIGGTVILISTGEVGEDSKIVYYGKKTYTIDKLSQFLGIPAQSTNSKGVADVIITIGKKKVNNLSF